MDLSVLLVALLLLNEASVCLTHLYAAAGHTHWAHRPWLGQIALFNWFHFFSFLRWPLLLAVCWQVWQGDYRYYVVTAVLAQGLWGALKWRAGKPWPNKWQQVFNRP